MKFNLETPENGYLIQSYDRGKIVVNEQIFTSSIVVGTNQIQPNWPPNTLSEVTSAHFESLLEFDPEIIIFGSG